MRYTHKSDETVRIEDKVVLPRPVIPYEGVHASRLQSTPGKALRRHQNRRMELMSTSRGSNEAASTVNQPFATTCEYSRGKWTR